MNNNFKYLYNKIKPNIKINNKIFGKDTIVIAGPCTIHDEESLLKIALNLKKLGVDILRGGAFKPRKDPYSFQGLEEKGLDILINVKKLTGLPIITEITSLKFLEKYINDVDIIQVGSKNMYNYELLKALGKTNKPILLKRSMSATYEDWLLASEYILKEGNTNVILCERGIRTFEKDTRFTLDIQAIPFIKNHSKLPIIVDPSHASGHSYMIKPMTLAALIAGADGVMIEVDDLDKAVCDLEQTVSINELKEILKDIKKI